MRHRLKFDGGLSRAGGAGVNKQGLERTVGIAVHEDVEGPAINCVFVFRKMKNFTLPNNKKPFNGRKKAPRVRGMVGIPGEAGAGLKVSSASNDGVFSPSLCRHQDIS